MEFQDPVTPVDVIAVFNPSGRIKPLYIRAEASDHTLHTFPVRRVLLSRREHYGGIRRVHYQCEVDPGSGSLECMDIFYNIDTHRWMIEPEYWDPDRIS